MINNIITFPFIITIMISISAMDRPLPQRNSSIELKSSDHQIVVMPLNVALQSPTLADILKHFQEGHTKSIPFTTIDGETLTTVVKILTSFYKHQDLKGKTLLNAVEKDTPIYDSNAILLLRAFDFLDFMPGVRLVARYIITNSPSPQSPRSFTDTIKDLFYGKPLMDYVINLIKTSQLSINTINEIGRTYYLIINKDKSEYDTIRFKNLPGIETEKITFSLRDYIDYLPSIIKERHKSGTLTLDLDNLNIIDLEGLEDIPGIQNIENLEINHTKITTLPNNFSLLGLTNLKRLYIIGGKLKAVPATCLHGLKKLEGLAISFQPLAEIPATVFQGLTHLKVLQLYTDKLEELPSILFNDLHNLEILSLGYNNLTVLPKALFDNLNKLQDLSLHNNQLIELPTSIFARLTNVRKIDLSSNLFQSLNPDLFKGLPHLALIAVDGNKLSEDNIQELKKAFPQTKIRISFYDRDL